MPFLAVYSKIKVVNFMPIDDNLLDRAQSQNADSKQAAEERAGDFRAAQGSGPDGNENQALDYRAAVQTARQEQASDEATDAKKQKSPLENPAANPALKGTNALLRSAWQNLIPSWGLTLIWINIHVFLRTVLGKNLFGKLGSEWKDQIPGGDAMGKGKALEDLEKGAAVGEGCVLNILNLGCIMVIIAAFSIVALLVKVIDNPFSVIADMLSGIWGALFGD